jgi:transposase-like protein
MESFQRDTTLEAVCQKFGVSRAQLSRWRQEFQENAPSLFVDKRNPKQKAISQGYEPGESPDDLKKIIGELTVQNEILKKAGASCWGESETAPTGGSSAPVVRTQWPLLEKPGGSRSRHRQSHALLAVQTGDQRETDRRGY